MVWDRVKRTRKKCLKQKKVQNIDTINAITEFSITLRTFRVQTWFYKVQKEQMRKTSPRMISVRVKGGKSLRNGMWNGVRNDIIMRNTIYAGNKLTEERIPFSRQLYKSSSFFDVADY